MRPEVCTPFHSLLISLQKVKRLGAGTGSSLGFIHHPEQILCYFQLFSLGKSRATGWVGSGTWRGHGTTSKRITWPKDRTWTQFSSVTKLCPTLCDPHGLQHTSLPCLSPYPGVLLRLMSIELVMPYNLLKCIHTTVYKTDIVMQYNG